MHVDALEGFQSGHKTAKKAATMLAAKGFIVPTGKQRQNLLVAFAKRGKVVYGRAFDVVKLSSPVDLDNLAEVEKHLEQIRVFEVKSTRKKLRPDFSGYF